jgi:soluble lytic murein transglycosylase
LRRNIFLPLLFIFFAQFAWPVYAQHSAKHSSRTSSKRKRSRRVLSPRLRRMARVFHASKDLRPMAQQLVENRTPQAYAGVEKYALRHSRDDAGALAQLVLGYAHVLDNDYAKAIPALQKAQRAKTELGDYVDYWLASAQAASGDSLQALVTSQDFALRHPESLFTREAEIIAANAMVASGNTPGAIELLEKHRSPLRADTEIALAHAYEQAGDAQKAVDTFRWIYFTLPLSPQSAAADFELQKLARQALLPPPSFTDRKTRADLLLQSHHFSDAAVEYQALVKDAPPDALPAVQVSLGGALWHSGKFSEARDLLERMPEPPAELGAQRLYYLIELYRPDAQKVEEALAALRANHPESPWLEEALLSTANMYVLKDNARAQQEFAELAERFPRGRHAPYASWRAAWLQSQLSGDAAAKTAFERHIELFPASSESGAAVYWRGRLAEKESDMPTAGAYYSAASEDYRHSYYAVRSRQRLALLKKNSQPASTQPQLEEPLLEKIQPPEPPKNVSVDPPEDNLRLQRSRLLENCALVDFAVRELQAAGNLTGANWAMAEAAHLYSEEGRDDRAIEVVKKALPGYFLFQISDLPQNFWQGLFPRPYWDNLKRYSAENRLDPYVVASLVRQESEFNPLAVSRADAIGLMQILPPTGKKLAHQVKVKGFNSSMLLDPAINLRLGSRYVRDLLDKYGGKLEYALAAYNAGPERVDEWLKTPYRDVDEFVESIPFTETREYVQAIVRNAEMYREIYPAP